MTYKGTLIAVRDMEKSRKFYQELLGLAVVSDFGANVQLEGGLYLQTLESWTGFLCGKAVSPGGNDGELYFEVADMDAFCKKLGSCSVDLVHGPLEHSWGQRVVRFYDPDLHIIEVAEDIAMVVRRFALSGMDEEQVARRMDVPVDFVRDCLKESDRIVPSDASSPVPKV